MHDSTTAAYNEATYNEATYNEARGPFSKTVRHSNLVVWMASELVLDWCNRSLGSKVSTIASF